LHTFISTNRNMSQEEIGPDLNASKYTDAQFSEMKAYFPETDNITLARFLIARNGDVAKSKAMYEDHLAWRAENWPALMSSCMNEFSKGKSYVKGEDKQGHPLIIFQTHLHDPQNRDCDELVRMAVFIFETAIREMENKTQKVTVLINRVQAGNGSDIEFARQLTTLLSNNYPERLYRTIVYPSSMVFYGIWQVVQLFMDPVTREKVKPVMYLSGVQEFIADEHIPKSMGGQSDYEFKIEDFSDPYPEDVVAAKVAKDQAAAAAAAAAAPA
jgi:hypothetical protein